MDLPLLMGRSLDINQVVDLWNTLHKVSDTRKKSHTSSFFFSFPLLLLGKQRNMEEMHFARGRKKLSLNSWLSRPETRRIWRRGNHRILDFQRIRCCRVGKTKLATTEFVYFTKLDAPESFFWRNKWVQRKAGCLLLINLL